MSQRYEDVIGKLVQCVQRRCRFWFLSDDPGISVLGMPRCFIVFLDLRISLQQTSFELQTAHLPRPRHPAACTRLLSELEQALCSRSVPTQPTLAGFAVYSINERTLALAKTRNRALHGRPTFRVVVGNEPVDGPNRGEKR